MNVFLISQLQTQFELPRGTDQPDVDLAGCQHANAAPSFILRFAYDRSDCAV